MPDYQSNSKKSKEIGADVPTNPKTVERITVNDVIVKKPGIGRKFRDLFIEADLKTVIRSVAFEVLVPAAKNMMFDSVNRGSERMLYGDTAARRRSLGGGPRVTYNNPVNRGGYGGSPLRYAPQPSPDPRPNTPRLGRTDLILSTQEEADAVLEQMKDLVDQYEVASVADLNALVGLPTSHIDNKWGWGNLSGTTIRQIREGYLIEFPPAEAI